MLNKFVLNFVMLFKSIYARFGVDVTQLRIILSTKMLMDDRRPNVYSHSQKKKKETNNASWLTMLVLLIMGVFLMVMLIVIKKPLVGQTIFFSAFMVMLAVTLISDFTSVLIDVRDNYIILPRPVSDITFTVARILHIATHTSKMAFALALPGLVYISIWEGPLLGLLFILQVFIATLLSIFLVNITYLIVLKITSPQRFKDFISYFQIILSVGIFAAYYTLPKLISASTLNSFEIKSIKTLAIVPSVWIAALNELAVNPKSADLILVVYASLALVSPFIAMYLVVKILAPGFNQKLSSISGSGNEDQTDTKLNNNNFLNKIAKVLAPKPIENAGFKITWLLTSRYRDFKVKVYPAFAYVPVYFFYFGFMNKKGSIAQNWENMREGNMYILLLYLTSFVLTSVLQHVSITEKHKAAWVYFSTPLHHPGQVLGGMFKAVIVKYFLPYFLAVGIFSISFWGIKVFNDLILVFMVSVIYALLIALFQVKGLPFSQPVNVKKGGKMFIGMFLMIIPAVLGFIHYWAAEWETAIWIFAALMTIAAWQCFVQYRKESWDSLEAIE
ncbi:hypothetical protein [Pedobacter alpinus]|uniref:ABC-2 type transport system permease protein n=1 Tax=Pedobacter alpinus TaxID=1590643 RepID=A0ABW5TRL9_9SPHI